MLHNVMHVDVIRQLDSGTVQTVCYRFSLHGSFTFYVDVFFPLSLPRLLLDLTINMSYTAGIL